MINKNTNRESHKITEHTKLNLKKMKNILISLLVFTCLFSCETRLKVKTVNSYDNNSTVLGFSKNSIQITENWRISKFCGGPNKSRVKKITKYLFLVEFKGSKFWISDVNYNVFINDLNFLLQHKDNFQFQVNSQWVEWLNSANDSRYYNFMTLDPNVTHPKFNVRLNKRIVSNVYYPNRQLKTKGRQSKKRPRNTYDPYKVIPGKPLNTPEFRRAVAVIETADAGRRAEFHVLNADIEALNAKYRKFSHNPYWVMKLIPRTHFAQINLSRVDEKKIKFNGVTIDENVVSDMVRGFGILKKYK
jgi:hypothetical protein